MKKINNTQAGNLAITMFAFIVMVTICVLYICVFQGGWRPLFCGKCLCIYTYVHVVQPISTTCVIFHIVVWCGENCVGLIHRSYTNLTNRCVYTYIRIYKHHQHHHTPHHITHSNSDLPILAKPHKSQNQEKLHLFHIDKNIYVYIRQFGLQEFPTYI